MSSTRHAKPGSPFRQDKFSSSAEFEKGLLANLVARRCSILESAEERELIWFLQLLSHHEGGLEKVAKDLAEQFSDRACTSKMLRFGMKPKQIYNSEQASAICREMPLPYSGEFPLRGESSMDIAELAEKWDDEDRRESRGENPDSYPTEEFLEICRGRLSQLEEDLKVFCLNPTRTLDSAAPWYFADLPACLRKYYAQWSKARGANTVTTELGQKVYDALDYALESKCMVLVEGMARTGKTFSAKAWCDQRPGRARYVQVPCTNDDIGFYRAIAKQLGLSSGLSWKAFELRERVEAVLQGGDLVIVFDEAHYLWPNLIDRRSLPARINWIMTALVNSGVSVGLITTPQFLKNQKATEATTRWTSEQFTGRIGHYEPLPEILSEKDLEKVARALLREGDDTSIETLVCYAKASAKYLAGIEAVVRRARYLAKRDGRDQANRADVKRAIKESVIPSDSALAQSLAVPSKTSGKRSTTPVQTPLRNDSSPLHHRADPALENLGGKSGETNRTRLDLTRDSRDLVSG